MSASAFQLYEFLLAAGIPGDHARALADALEKRFGDKMAGVATGADIDRVNVRLDRLEFRVGQLEVAMAETHKIAVQTSRLVMALVVAIIGAVISAGIF